MNRRHAIASSAALLIAGGPAAAQGPAQPPGERGTNKQEGDREAVVNYHAAQAALYSALAYAEALDKLADRSRAEDMDLARSYVHTINREIQAVTDSSVKVGQAMHAIEKNDKVKQIRSQMDQALQAADKAQDAVDGIGNIAPHAKNVEAHLLNAAIALFELGEVVGAEPLSPPGINALRDVRKGR
jgi:hypothetical protein